MEISLMAQIEPLEPPGGQSLEFFVNSGQLNPTNTTSSTVLVVVKLLHEKDLLSISVESRTQFQSFSEFRCTKYVEEELNFCKVDPVLQRLEQEHRAWNLGSMLCQSAFGKVCDLLTVTNSETVDKCNLVGCGHQAVPDLAVNSCVTIQQQTALQGATEAMTWTGAAVCDYYSRCKTVELGLIKEGELNCYCDEFCPYFNDCCEDSNYQAAKSSKLEPGIYTCIDAGYENFEEEKSWGLMAVNKCPSNFAAMDDKSEKTKKNCNNRFFEHPAALRRIPVTDKQTGIVYVCTH